MLLTYATAHADKRTKAGKSHKLGYYQAIMGYLFIAPSVVLFIIFTGIPIINAFYLSFTNYDVLSTAEWVGLRNYKKLLGDEIFLTSLKNILFYVAMYVPLMIICSLVIALALNRKLPGTNLFRTVYYIPGLTSSIAASTVWMWILNPEYGLLNQILSYVGIVGPAWLANTSTAMISIVMVTLWQGIGGNMVIYLAGLQGIPNILYESAKLDGANKWLLFFYITLPGLRPTTFFIFIMSMIGSFQLFDQAFAMTQGGPGYSTTTPVYLIYNEGFNQLNMGYASAMAFVLFVIILAFSFLNFRLNSSEQEG